MQRRDAVDMQLHQMPDRRSKNRGLRLHKELRLTPNCLVNQKTYRKQAEQPLISRLLT
jgi:hypothetical protein